MIVATERHLAGAKGGGYSGLSSQPGMSTQIPGTWVGAVILHFQQARREADAVAQQPHLEE